MIYRISLCALCTTQSSSSTMRVSSTVSRLSPPPFPASLLPLPTHSHRISPNILAPTRSSKRIRTIRVSSPDNRTVTVAQSPAAEINDDDVIQSASDVVRSFYGGINSHDLGSVEKLIAENCVYEDLIFPSPFVGRKAILEFFKKFTDSISTDLQFAIDDISAEDSVAVGVTWHLEWKGKPFPFSKGCSFYRLEVLNGKKQIVYGRDSVEPAIKPGETALVAIRGATWLLQQFPRLAEQL